jgi:hypothetical protein
MWPFIVATIAIAVFAAGPVDAAGLTIEQATIKGGKLLVTGRTAKPNQIVEIVETGDKTVSLASRRFTFSLSYSPPNCKLNLRTDVDSVSDQVVSSCLQRGNDGRDGKDGAPGRDGKEGFTYGTLPGDGAAFKCWASDVIGLWYMKDYPAPNSRTIAHIAPDRIAGGNKLNVTDPDDPRKATRSLGPITPQWAEFDGEKLYILNRDTYHRIGVHGEVSPDCKSIVWKGERDRVLSTWAR